MLTGFLAPLRLMLLKNNPAELLPIPYRWVGAPNLVEDVKSSGKQVVLLYDPQIAPSATEFMKAVNKLGASAVTAPHALLDSEDTYAKVLKFFDLKSLGSVKVIVVPQGKNVTSFWECVNSLVSAGITKSPSFDSFGIESMSVHAMCNDMLVKDVKVSETYLYRSSVVNRMTRQANTQNCQVTLLNSGSCGGRELAEYRFVRNVKSTITPDAWLLADNMVQLGIPTQGCDCASTTDYELFGYPDVQHKTENNTTKENIFISNTLSLKGLAG